MYRLIIATFCIFLVQSCITTKKQTYFIGAITQDSARTYQNPITTYQLRPADVLYVKIISADPRLSAPFNVDPPQANLNATPNNLFIQGYVINDTGFVEIPLLGVLPAQGLTLLAFKQQVETKVAGMVSGATVVVKFASFKVSVIGEVNRKGQVYFPNERVSIIEALAQAGDITMFGKRHQVEVLRQQVNGTFEKGVVNLMDPNAVYNPYFYLQPNDIVNVPPNKTLGARFNVTNLTLAFAAVTTVLLVLNFLQN